MSSTAHFSLEHYEHMVETGAFAGKFQKRIELLRGEIRMMSPIGIAHSQAVIRITDWSYQSVDLSKIMIRVQTALRIPTTDSEPEPDLAWVKQKGYDDQHPEPEDVVLIVEVADSSLDTDRTEKLAIYAEARIAEYWIVNLIDRPIEVCRRPRNTTYHDEQVYRQDEVLAPLAQPTASLTRSRFIRED